MKNKVKYLLELKREFTEDEVSAYAAQSSYFMILSFIPFLIVFSSLLRVTPVTEADVLNLVNDSVPVYLKSFLIFIVDEVYHNSVESISITALVAVWSAAKGIQYLSGGLNRIYDLKETRNWLFLRIRAIGYTLAFTLMIETLLILIVFAGKLYQVLCLNLPGLKPALTFFMRFRVLIVPAVLILFFALAYKALPNRRLSYKSQLPGAVICGIAWYVFSFGLSVYVNYFNGFSMYGSLVTIVLLMFWLYFCLMIFLVCGEINSLGINR